MCRFSLGHYTRLLRFILKGPVVITGDDNLMPMRQGSQPVVEIFDVFQRALAEAVTGMDQNVPVRNMRDFSVQAVSIRDADQFHGKAPGGVISSASSDQSMKGRSRTILRASSTPL